MGVEQLQFDDRLTQLVTSGSGEFKVNTSTAGSQLNADITALDNGGFVVTWQSEWFGTERLPPTL